MCVADGVAGAFGRDRLGDVLLRPADHDLQVLDPGSTASMSGVYLMNDDDMSFVLVSELRFGDLTFEGAALDP
jgi:hypothetical protein